jgi:hypothetical protein
LEKPRASPLADRRRLGSRDRYVFGRPRQRTTANVNPYHRTVVHHVYTYEPAPNPYYYGPYYGPSYAPEYVPAAPITALPGAAVCLAFSLIGAC